MKKIHLKIREIIIKNKGNNAIKERNKAHKLTH